MKHTFGLAGIAVAVAMLGMSPAEAQESRKLTFQTSYPAGTPTYESLQYWGERVGKMSGGRLVIETMPAGALVPAFEVVDAIAQGVLDGGQSAPAYSVGKNSAATLFGPAPGGPFGMDALDYVGWIYDGGGLELYQGFYREQLKLNVVPFPMTYAGQQPLGWFKQEINGWADLAGRKCRQTGMTAEVFAPSGMAAVNIAGGEIVPSGERGTIDCAEFAGPHEDSAMGFQTVWKEYYLTSMHEPATVLEIMINGEVWESLTPDLQEIMRSATWEATFRYMVKLNKLNADALEKLREGGINIHRTPEDILVETLKSWDAIAEKEAAANPYFKTVYESQRSYASKVVPGRETVEAPYSLAADYYWGKSE
jgi:TRAP-type mannitol/chloroaromatic compound transport system substrate-binding protein